MNTATHKSQCGKWLYKRSELKKIHYEYGCARRFQSDNMQFWDSYCNKWRESAMLESQTKRIN